MYRRPVASHHVLRLVAVTDYRLYISSLAVEPRYSAAERAPMLVSLVQLEHGGSLPLIVIALMLRTLSCTLMRSIWVTCIVVGRLVVCAAGDGILGCHGLPRRR